MANSSLDPQLMKMLRGEGFTNIVPSTFNFNDNCILLIIILIILIIFKEDIMQINFIKTIFK